MEDGGGIPLENSEAALVCPAQLQSSGSNNNNEELCPQLTMVARGAAHTQQSAGFLQEKSNSLRNTEAINTSANDGVLGEVCYNASFCTSTQQVNSKTAFVELPPSTSVIDWKSVSHNMLLIPSNSTALPNQTLFGTATCPITLQPQLSGSNNSSHAKGNCTTNCACVANSKKDVNWKYSNRVSIANSQQKRMKKSNSANDKLVEEQCHPQLKALSTHSISLPCNHSQSQSLSPPILSYKPNHQDNNQHTTTSLSHINTGHFTDKAQLVSTHNTSSASLDDSLKNCNGNFNHKHIVCVCHSQNNSKCNSKMICKYVECLVQEVVSEAMLISSSLGWSIRCSLQCKQDSCQRDVCSVKKMLPLKDTNNDSLGKRSSLSSFKATVPVSSSGSGLCWTPELLPVSPFHNKSYSGASLGSSLSFSHDSLMSGISRLDDSHLITGAVSHDALLCSTGDKGVSTAKSLLPRNSDVYSVPVDVVKPFNGIAQPKAILQRPAKPYPWHSANHSLLLLRNANGAVQHLNKTGKACKISFEKKIGTKEIIVRKKQNLTGDEISSVKQGANRCTGNGHLPICEENAEESVIAKKKEVEREKGEPSKLCRMIPFTSFKTCRRRDCLSIKCESKKRTRSLTTNIRNTLFTLFGLRRPMRKTSHCSSVNAKNEFVSASPHALIQSADTVHWGKICPLPSVPPLKHTHNTASAFTPTTNAQNTTKNEVPMQNNNSTSNNIKPSNVINSASLFSCLGHTRTTNTDNHKQTHNHTKPASDSSTDTNNKNYKVIGDTAMIAGADETAKRTASPVLCNRALPPLPSINVDKRDDEGCDFASNIERVKDYGWYWGPISGESAEKILSSEPDGSFIVRDSSDDHYIFSLTFRLKGVTRHVRIEHDQGNFSFGGSTRFKSQTIVEFIENAVEHSRSGRYLFFLHRRPVLGPMRVQLLHPVSRFKRIQSLQHLCRFVIVKQVRRDLLTDLPLPKRLKDYLASPHYYSEQVEKCMLTSQGESKTPQVTLQDGRVTSETATGLSTSTSSVPTPFIRTTLSASPLFPHHLTSPSFPVSRPSSPSSIYPASSPSPQHSTPSTLCRCCSPSLPPSLSSSQNPFPDLDTDAAWCSPVTHPSFLAPPVSSPTYPTTDGTQVCDDVFDAKHSCEE